MSEETYRYKKGDLVECTDIYYYPTGTQLIILSDNWAMIDKYKVMKVEEKDEKFRFISADSIKLIQK